MKNKPNTSAQPIAEPSTAELHKSASRLIPNPDHANSFSVASLLEEIQAMNGEVNQADEQIAFHHLEEEKWKEQKAKLVLERTFFKDELHKKMGEK